jgi:hypothetical protein
MATPNGMNGAADLIFAAFNHQTFDQNNMDVGHMQIYDTVTIAAAGSVTPLSANYFTSVGPQSGKTAAQTNMATPRQLQTPQAFSIMGIRYRVGENIALGDFIAIVNGFALEFQIGGKLYQQAPLWIFAAGGGIFGLDPSATTSIYSNGVPTRESMNRLNIPLVIDNTAQFFGLLDGNPYTLLAAGGGTLGTGFTSQYVLDGFYARGIQ